MRLGLGESQQWVAMDYDGIFKAGIDLLLRRPAGSDAVSSPSDNRFQSEFPVSKEIRKMLVAGVMP